MEKIEELRSEIDVIHAELSKLFLRRLDLVSEIVALKKQNDIPLLDLNREIEIQRFFQKFARNKREELALAKLADFLLKESKNTLSLGKNE